MFGSLTTRGTSSTAAPRTRRSTRSVSLGVVAESRREATEPRSDPRRGTRRKTLLGGVLTPFLLYHGSKSHALEDTALRPGTTRFVTGDDAFPSFSSPEPVPIPRRTLRPDFAVSLLRTGYETADSMDFVAMDTFQQDFWLTRRAEWESYKLLYDPILIEQGKIADPLYFDFISAVQFETISREMKQGKQVFKEYCGDGCTDGYAIVTRPPELQDNALLPSEFCNRLGEYLYNKLAQMEDFNNEVLHVISSSMEPYEVAHVVEEYFQKLGYCVKFDIEHGSLGKQFTIKSYGGVNSFALQYLKNKGSSVYPLYDGLLLAFLFRRLQFSCSVLSASWSNVLTTQTFEFK